MKCILYFQLGFIESLRGPLGPWSHKGISVGHNPPVGCAAAMVKSPGY